MSFCAFLAVFAAAYGQDLDRKVSFSMPATRASVLLPELGKQAGLPLTAFAKAGDEVLLVKVKDVSVKDLMAKIAIATNATWKQVGGGYELIRSTELDNQAERAEREAQAKKIQDGLEAANEKLAKAGAFTQEQADKMAAEQQKRYNDMASRVNGTAGPGANIRINRSGDIDDGSSPASRAIYGMLNAIGAQDLAKIADGERVVYSTNANSVQRPLPGRATESARDFVKQAQMLANAMEKLKADDSRTIRISEMNGSDIGPGNPALGLGKAVLSLQRFGPSLRTMLIVTDPNGETITFGATNFLMAKTGAGTPPAQPADSGQKIVLSPLAAEFGQSLSQASPTIANGVNMRTMQMVTNGVPLSFSMGAPGVKPIVVSKELRARITNPEKFDPQSLALTEGFVAAADAHSENLVADLPDSAIMPITRSLTQGESVEHLLTKSARAGGVKLTEEDGWMIATSATPMASRGQRMDRIALGKLLRTLDSQALARLNDLTTFALSQDKTVGRNDYDGLAMLMVNLIGGSEALESLSNQPNVLRFFGTLTSQQRSQLESGGALVMNTLSPTQAKYLSLEVYQSMMGPSSKAPARQGMSLSRTLNEERTELMPVGIPNAGTLVVKIDRTPAAIGTEASGVSTIFTPNTLASRMLQTERTDLQFFGPVQKIDKYQAAGQTQIALHFDFPQMAQMDRSLSDTWVESNQTVAYDGLPQEMRSKTDALLANIRQSLGTVKFAPAIAVGGGPIKGRVNGGNIPPMP